MVASALLGMAGGVLLLKIRYRTLLVLRGNQDSCLTRNLELCKGHRDALTGWAGGKGAEPCSPGCCLWWVLGDSHGYFPELPVEHACPESQPAEKSTYLFPTCNLSLFWVDLSWGD